MLGVNDSLLDDFEQLGATRQIPREDVANLVVEVLRYNDLVDVHACMRACMVESMSACMCAYM